MSVGTLMSLKLTLALLSNKSRGLDAANLPPKEPVLGIADAVLGLLDTSDTEQARQQATEAEQQAAEAEQQATEAARLKAEEAARLKAEEAEQQAEDLGQTSTSEPSTPQPPTGLISGVVDGGATEFLKLVEEESWKDVLFIVNDFFDHKSKKQFMTLKNLSEGMLQYKEYDEDGDSINDKIRKKTPFYVMEINSRNNHTNRLSTQNPWWGHPRSAGFAVVPFMWGYENNIKDLYDDDLNLSVPDWTMSDSENEKFSDYMDKSIAELKRVLKLYDYKVIVYCKEVRADGKDAFGLTKKAEEQLRELSVKAVSEVQDYFQKNVIDMIASDYELKETGFIKLTAARAEIEYDASVKKEAKDKEDAQSESLLYGR
jgi:hypothetical protein